MTAALVDDHLLLAILLGEGPRLPRGQVSTTGLWYHRLARALVASPVEGSMSRSLGGIHDDLSRSVIAAITSLPDEIGLTSLRDLAAPMAHLLADGIRLNLLSLEALAAAEHLDATICLSIDDRNEPLLRVAAARGVEVAHIASERA